ncbi:MAG: MCE family protein [Rhodospirillales bacterium]|nr:MCE family protein [Rhodospirillales bacterium]
MSEDVRNIIVGGITVFVLVVIGVASFSSSKIEASNGISINAVFNRIDGLQKRDEVRIAGIKIGEVTSLTLGKGFSATVGLNIETDAKIPTDSSAAIHTESLFGSKFIVIEPGAADGFVAAGDTIDLTQDSIVVQDLLELIIGEAKANQAKMKAAQK